MLYHSQRWEHHDVHVASSILPRQGVTFAILHWHGCTCKPSAPAAHIRLCMLQNDHLSCYWFHDALRASLFVSCQILKPVKQYLKT